MSFLAPAFLSGLALLVIPYLIHKIRRPERSVVQFSSLMFVPTVKKEVIERRRIQHLLLLLLRLLLFLILVLAFSRPFRETSSSQALSGSRVENHLLLIDCSASMTVAPGFAAVRDKASEVLDQIPDQAEVGVVTFADRPTLALSLQSPNANKTGAQTLVSGLQPSQAHTAYLPALRFAEEHLLGHVADQTNPPLLVIHFISDFRKNGLPPTLPAWRLSGRIKFVGHEVGAEPFKSVGITDLAIRKNQDQLVALARVRNHTSEKRQVTVRLNIDQKAEVAVETTLAPSNSSLVQFPLDPNSGPLHGRVSLDADAFPLDDMYYFTWRAPQGQRIRIVAPAGEQAPYQPAWFFAKALQATSPYRWLVELVPPQAFLSPADPMTPDLLLFVGVPQMNTEEANRLLTWVEEGGKLWICLDEQSNLASWNQLLLDKVGLSVAKNTNRDSARVAWLNFAHPALFSFRGALTNDFSNISFQKAHILQPTDTSKTWVKLDQRHGNPAPVIAESSLGNGRVLVWGFSPRLATTNLPKHAKFVPFVQESLVYLTNTGQDRRVLRVGDTLNRSDLPPTPTFQMKLPEGSIQTMSSQAPVSASLTAAGFIEVRSDENTLWSPWDAVNIPPQEGDPTVLGAQEFSLKLTANAPQSPQAATGDPRIEAPKRLEMGFYALAWIFPLLLLETFFAHRLTHPSAPKKHPEGAV